MKSPRRLGGHLLGLWSLVLALLLVGGSVAVVRADDGDFVAGEVVVKLNSTADLGGVASQYGLGPVPLSQFGSRPIYRLRITDSTPVEQKVTQLLADPQLRVVYAEPNFLSTAPEANKPSWSIGDGYGVGGELAAYQNQLAAQTIRLSVAHQVTRGAGVTVAVLDTGVDATHPLLAGRLVPGFDFVDFDNDPSEVGSLLNGPYGHGTHVAGLVALVAPEAKIMPVRVLDQNGVGNIWVLAEALAFAVNPDGNPLTHDGADVINLSLSTLRRTRLLQDILSGVSDDVPGADDYGFGSPGVIVVAAAGNRGGTTEEYPAAENINGLLAVAASTEYDRLATFSTRGSWIRVMAPGTNILSSVPGGQYGTWRGTSMAAPLVAGEAALLRAAFPNLRNAKVTKHIEDTAVRTQEDVVRDRIDVGKALTTQPEVEPTPTPAIMQFSSASYNAGEGDARLDVTVTRTGNTLRPVAVSYATTDTAGLNSCSSTGGIASSRCDYATTIGTLHFAAGETSKTLTIPLVDDSLTEGTENFSIRLNNPLGATLGPQSTATLSLTDNEPSALANPIDQTAFFVRQHYIDFLGREPEPAGFQGWQDIINNCALGSPACDRIEVSSAFFRSTEFQERGYFVYRFYSVSLGRFPRYAEFIPDLARVSGFQTPAEQEASKVAFINEFMARPEFRNRYDSTLGNARAFVEALLATAGVTLPAKESLIADLQVRRLTPGQVLRQIAESAEVSRKFYNESFVVMQYFGYLRRDPDALYQNWIQTLNQTGDYRTMVNGFMNSVEYRQRFGQ